MSGYCVECMCDGQDLVSWKDYRDSGVEGLCEECAGPNWESPEDRAAIDAWDWDHR